MSNVIDISWHNRLYLEHDETGDRHLLKICPECRHHEFVITQESHVLCLGCMNLFQDIEDLI